MVALVVFPVSGVQTPIWLPPLAAFVVSFFSSMGGISGAVLLLPFQMSVLGFTSPAVSPTNLVFNIVAIPSGIYRYAREGRLLKKLTWLIAAGTAPGVVVGELVRLKWLPNARPFKAFAGCVLLYIGLQMLLHLRRPNARMRVANWGRPLVVDMDGRRYQCGTLSVFLLALVVGMVGGIYGIGGGAIIAPFLVAVAGLPVYAIAGATLMGTFISSVAGVGFSQLISALSPDWMLGLLFGIGGMAGMYLGARAQRYVPAQWLKTMLAAILLAVGSIYLWGYFFTSPVAAP